MTITQILMAAYKKPSQTPPVDTFPDARLIALFNGTNGSTSFTDSSPYNVALTSVNGAALSTVAPLTGSSSLLLDTVDQYVTATIPIFEFGGTQKWCFEWTCSQNNFSQYFAYFTVIGNIAGELYCCNYDNVFYVGDGTTYNTISVAFSELGLTVNTKYKMALSYDGVTYRFFINGNLIQTSTQKLNNAGGQLLIGGRAGGGQFFDGKIDDFVVTMNSAKRTANYTPS